MKIWRGFGAEVMAISHNGNASIGKVFSPLDSDGNMMTAEYTKRRLRNEPLHEAGQTKGVSMAHPMFSPNDEWANFELWNYDLSTGHPTPARRSSYVREAWKIGLGLEPLIGVNPFKTGVEGGSDTHGVINGFEEFDCVGNHAMMDNTPENRRPGMPGRRLGAKGGSMFLNRGTLTGVWAGSNTRGPIFDAMAHKETYATSGARISVRFFAGHNYPDALLDDRNWLAAAYSGGVPMGADLQADKNGKSPPVGDTVDLKTATYSTDIGDLMLSAVWFDLDFDADQNAVHYVRVLEIPTPRWTTYDAVELGLSAPDVAPSKIQERAWTSPIWSVPATK